MEDEIRQRTHKLWLDKGNPDGHANWIAAERELHQEAIQKQKRLDKVQNAVFTAIDLQNELKALGLQLEVAHKKTRTL